MARPAPDVVFEVFGLEASEFVIGKEDRTKVLFALRDSRDFVARYFFSEMLTEPDAGRFDVAALMGGKYDKKVHFGQGGVAGSRLNVRAPIRVDQFDALRRAMIVSAERTSDRIALGLKLRRKDDTVVLLNLIFDTTGSDPTDLLFPMFGSDRDGGESHPFKGPLIPTPQGFDAARKP